MRAAEILLDLRLGSHRTALSPCPWVRTARGLLPKGQGASNPRLWGRQKKRHEKTALVVKSPPIPACFDSEFLCYGRLVEKTDFRCLAVGAVRSASPPKPKGLIPSAREKPGSPPADHGVHHAPPGSGRGCRTLGGEEWPWPVPTRPGARHLRGTKRWLQHLPRCRISQHPCLFPAVSLHLRHPALQVFQPLQHHPRALRAFSVSGPEGQSLLQPTA